MRILTVRQPWAWSIIHGGKDVENRSRNIAGGYRGPVAIHVAQSAACRIGEHLRGDHFDFERDRSGYLARSPRLAWPYRLPYVEGHIIGLVDLTDVHDGASCSGGEDPDGPTACSLWAMTGYQHLVLANPRPLNSLVLATGRLGLWKPTPDLADQIAESLDEKKAKTS